jgi:HisJ family histidinol phosphate phosphatase
VADPRIAAIPDVHGHAKGEHRPFAEERPIAYSARMLFLWFYHACRRGSPRFLMVADHINYLTFEDPGAVNTVRRALKLAQAGDVYGAAETAGVEPGHAYVVSEGLRRGMRFSIGAEADNDPRARPDAQNIVEAMRPDGIIRSVNFIPIEHPEKGADWAWAFDSDEFAALHEVVGAEVLWERYAAKLFDDLEKLPTNIVGHFYAPAGFGGWPAAKRLEEYEDRLLTICHARGLAVEVNTRFLYRDRTPAEKQRYLEANARLVRKARALGVGIAVGSGAHSPKDQGNGFDAALKILDDAGVNELVFPVNGQLARVALRATREHLEAQANRRESQAPGSSITGYSRAELGLPEPAEKPATGRRDSSRPGRGTAAKKRASGSTREGTRAEAPPAKSPGKSGSSRTAESSQSSNAEKAARAKASKPAAKPPKAAAKALPKPAVKAPAKSAAKSAAKTASKASPKTAAKPAASKPAAKPAKPPAKKKAPAHPVAVKTPAKARPPVKSAAKKVSGKKSPAKKAAPKRAPAKKSSVKRVSARKPSTKKSVAKKPAAKQRAASGSAKHKKTVRKAKPAAKRR